MTSADDLTQKLQELWQKSLPLMLRRLEVIGRAHEALVGNNLDETLQADAAHEAHNLAGSLGVFGLHRGSEAALEIERLLLCTDTLESTDLSALREHLQRLTRDIKNK